MVFGAVLTLLVTGASGAPTTTRGDWFASLYTPEGVELRSDERVFALYALFNAAGFDEGAPAREVPFRKVTYHPVRQDVRSRVLGTAPELRRVVDDYLEAHPESAERYLACALGGPPAPFTGGLVRGCDLKGLDGLLGRAWADWRLDDLHAKAQLSHRQALQPYLKELDGALARLKDALHRPVAAPVVVVNLLDAPGAVRAVNADGQLVVIVGPSERPNLAGVLAAVARPALLPLVTGPAAHWAAGAATLKEAQVLGHPAKNVPEYLADVLAQALALRLVAAPDGEYEAAAAHGAFGIREMLKGLDERKSGEGWVGEAVQRIESRRPAKK